MAKGDQVQKTCTELVNKGHKKIFNRKKTETNQQQKRQVFEKIKNYARLH